MPAQQRFRLHDKNSVQQSRKQSVEPDQQETVQIPQVHAAGMFAAQDDQLLAKEEIFHL
jgi:hypothetical protein